MELGGTDQKFNLLLGRELQADHGQARQVVATMPILEGLDGVKKMSKSLDNYIAINEPVEVMYRKVMQISDELMYRYYELLTDLPIREIDKLKQGVAEGTRHPMDLKHSLAKRIVEDFHGEEDAVRGRDAFRRVVQNREVPDGMPEMDVPEDMRGLDVLRIDKLLRAIGLANSGADANRKLRRTP